MPHRFEGPGSLERRPDAISSDYTFAHSFGPVQLSDFSRGVLDRAWQVRVDNSLKKVFARRANDANTAWEADTEILTFTGESFTEVDAAFDQQGRIFVCAERPTGASGGPEIWMYYFNGLVGHYVFESFGEGRTPRVILDDPVNSSNADLLVFYLDDIADRLRYRQQRDRYQIVYNTPLIGILDSFLEDTIVSEDYRVQVYYSTRNVELGQYEIRHLETVLYPVVLPAESKITGHISLGPDSILSQNLLLNTLVPEDFMKAAISLPSDGELFVALITAELLFDDMRALLSLAEGGTLTFGAPTINSHLLYDTADMKASVSFGAGNILRVSLINHMAYDIHQVKGSVSLAAGGTLV